MKTFPNLSVLTVTVCTDAAMSAVNQCGGGGGGNSGSSSNGGGGGGCHALPPR